jgi:ferredoxin
MAYKINEECINCGACEPECPNTAIYQGGVNWELAKVSYGEGAAAPSGANGFYSNDFFYVVPDKCTECSGFHDAPQCVEVCPVDACVADTNHVEEKDQLLKKKEYLDQLGR